MIKKLHHNAYRCRDFEQTRAFYEDFMGLPLSGTLEINETKSGRKTGALHTFYALDDGSYLAFFEAPDPYDTVRDFLPVTRLVTANLMLVIRPDLPVSNMRELIEHVKKNPGKLTYASVGAGGVNHLPMAWLSNQNGLTMEHIPYKGLQPALQDLVAGRVDMMVAAKFANDAARIIAIADFKPKFLANLGFEPVGDSPDQFAAFLKGDRELAAQKVKVSGAKLD